MTMQIDRQPSGNFRWQTLVLGIAASAVAGCSQRAEPAAPDDTFEIEAQALTNRFQSELQATLSSAMSETGPVGAIGVCQSAAPAIAQTLSQESGLKISRIARKNRNAGNALGGELEGLYEELENSPNQDGVPTQVYSQHDGRQIYMRAIPMQEQPCAACHGTGIAPEVKAAIAEAYPEDLATGFEPGELRGAFLVESSAIQD